VRRLRDEARAEAAHGRAVAEEQGLILEEIRDTLRRGFPPGGG
jgi:hypothetical protein